MTQINGIRIDQSLMRERLGLDLNPNATPGYFVNQDTFHVPDAIKAGTDFSAVCQRAISFLRSRQISQLNYIPNLETGEPVVLYDSARGSSSVSNTFLKKPV